MAQTLFYNVKASRQVNGIHVTVAIVEYSSFLFDYKSVAIKTHISSRQSCYTWLMRCLFELF